MKRAWVEEIAKLQRYGLIYEDVDFGKSPEGSYLSRDEVLATIKEMKE